MKDWLKVLLIKACWHILAKLIRRQTSIFLWNFEALEIGLQKVGTNFSIFALGKLSIRLLTIWKTANFIKIDTIELSFLLLKKKTKK